MNKKLDSLIGQKAAMYREALETASLEKLTKLINIVALLLQTKF